MEAVDGSFNALSIQFANLDLFDRIVFKLGAASGTNITVTAYNQAAVSTQVVLAYIAFNAFSTAVGRFSGRLEGFADDLSTAIQRRLAEKV